MKMLNPRQYAVRVVSILLMVCINSVSAEVLPDSIARAPSELTNFVKNSLNQQPKLLAAKAEVMAAKANLNASKQAIYNPELELAYEDATDITKTIGVNQTIDWGDKRGSRTAIANADLLSKTTYYTVTAQDFVIDVLKGLAQSETAKQLVLLSSETLKLMQQFGDIAERRHQAGDLNQVDLNLAHLAYSQAMMEQAKRLSTVSQTREQLRAIVGALPAEIPLLPENFSQPVLQNNLESFLMGLPNIRLNMAEVQSNRQKIALRKSEQAWDPTIGITAGTEGNNNLIGLNLTIPFNVRNNFSAEVDVAYQKMIASEQRAQQAYRNTRANLIATTERYRHLLSAWNDWRKNSRDSVTQQLKLINQLWQSGDISAADYLLQIKQALEIKATGLELRNELWQAAFEWMRLTASVDNWLNINLQENN